METRERGLAQGVMRGGGSSAGRLEAGKQEVNWRGGKCEEGAAALAVRIGKGMEGEGTRGPPCTWERCPRLDWGCNLGWNRAACVHLRGKVSTGEAEGYLSWGAEPRFAGPGLFST